MKIGASPARGPITLLGLLDESPEKRSERILDGVFANLFRLVPQSVLVSIVGGMAMVAAFWHTQNQFHLILWFICLLLEALVRLRSARDFLLGAPRLRTPSAWAVRWLWMSAASGFLWGIAGYHFYFEEPAVLQLVFVALILGVAFGSLTLYATYTPALFAYLPLALLPLVGRMLGEHETAYYTGSAMVLAVLGFALYFGRNFGRTMAESVKSNLENEELVRQLMAEKRTAEEARRAAEAATRSKTQFFAAASHDLRQPLQAIGIYCSLLRKRAHGPLVPLVRNLSTGVESLSKLVEELLEISRLDSGVIQPQITDVPLVEIFLVLQREFLPLAAARRLDLRIRPTNLAVRTDALLLSRVLRNLIANAVRYTARGGIMLAARARGATVRIEVWDTGPGIHEPEINRIFDEFYRGESSKGEGGVAAAKGFGLGLSIVRRICGVLGHPLTVRTRPGSGTMFRVELPSVVVTRPVRGTLREEPEWMIHPISGYTVVLLEDNEDILNSLSRLLLSWGANVISSTGFTGALVKRLGADRRVDLIIADQQLGGPVDGAEAVFRVRELIGVPLPVIMLTAVGPLEVMAEFHRQMQARMRSNPSATAAIARSRVEEPIVLTKPASAAVLNARIVAALGLTVMDPDLLASSPAVSEGRDERIL